jgi:RNA polymerase-binding transcription factor
VAKAKTKMSKKKTTKKKPAVKKASKKAVSKKAAKKKVTAKKTPAKKKPTAKKRPAATKTTAKKKIVKKKPAAKKKIVGKKPAAKKRPTKKKVAKKPPASKKKKTAKVARSTAKPAPKRKSKPSGAARPSPTAATPQPRPRLVRKLVNLEGVKIPLGYSPSANEEYMNLQHLAFFKQKLENWRDELIVESQETLEHLRTETRDVGDEAERASRESDNILELRTRDRYRKLLRKIEEAIKRIEEGTYGYCEETGEEIGLGRLQARPIATLTVDAQERREMFQKQFRDDR